MPNGLFFILASVACSSIAHFVLKVGANSLASVDVGTGMALAAMRNIWIWLGMGLHVSALGLWIVALSRTELSFAYPFIALGFVATTLAGAWLLNEPVSTMRWGGVGLIVAGVVLAARG
jgi:multidrug transporter EmrE-like cation transporter